MNWLELGLGLLLLGAAIADALWTTLWVDGSAGPLSARLTAAVWWVFRRLFARRRHVALSLNGPVTLVLTLALWVAMLWVGWTLVFSAAPDALHDTRSFAQPQIDLSDRFYYVGYTMFTMGNGDFVPTADVWEVASALCTATGMMMITLAISYVLNVVSAVVAKRSLASQISSLGCSAEELVTNLWDGDGFRGAGSILPGIATQLTRVTEQHMAYPILHYYHAARPEKSTASTMVILDDALNLLRWGVSKEVRPANGVLHSVEAGIETYLNALERAWIGPAAEPTAAPSLAALREAGIPTVEEGHFDDALRAHRKRRRLIRGVLEKGEGESPPLRTKPRTAA